MDSKVNLMNRNQIIYIPSYVEQGTELLKNAINILDDIARGIDRGLGIINSSGYDREIPYIEKGQVVSSSINLMQDTIATIIRELENYSNGNNILPEDAIIVADLETADKYGLNKSNITFTLEDYVNNYRANPKWTSNYLTAAAGSITYYAKDGRYTRETWCDLNPNNLAKLMKEQGIDLDFWIREDGVYMYGDYVMVAADIPHMDGTEQAAEYRKGDLVETSLGTGMVVDLCGMAEMVRKGELAGTKYSDVEVWYDIYTAWHDGGKYQEIGYSESPNNNGSAPIGTPTDLIETNNPSAETVSPATTLELKTGDDNLPQKTNEIPVTNQNTNNQKKSYLQNLQSVLPVKNSDTQDIKITDQFKKTDNQNIPVSSASSTTNPQNTIVPVETINIEDRKDLSIFNTKHQESSVNYTLPSNNNSNVSNLNTSDASTISLQATSPVYNETLSNGNNSEIENRPIEPKPIENNYESLNNNAETKVSKSGINSIAILTSLGLTTAAGVGTKIYMNNNKHKKSEDKKFEDNNEYIEDFEFDDSND